MLRFVTALAFSLTFAGTALASETDPTRHALTLPELQHYRKASHELRKLEPNQTAGEDPGMGLSVEAMARKLEAQPAARPILASHGFTSYGYALAAQAFIHSALYLALEPSMEQKKAASIYAGYPKEQQANIELLRKHPELKSLKP